MAAYDRQALIMVLVLIQRLMRLLGHDPSSGDDTRPLRVTMDSNPGSSAPEHFTPIKTEFVRHRRLGYRLLYSTVASGRNQSLPPRGTSDSARTQSNDSALRSGYAPRVHSRMRTRKCYAAGNTFTWND